MAYNAISYAGASLPIYYEMWVNLMLTTSEGILSAAVVVALMMAALAANNWLYCRTMLRATQKYCNSMADTADICAPRCEQEANAYRDVAAKIKKCI